ncbi:MAG: hypothetical protein ACRD0H_05395, partial [Actinomycetes bacterium]
MARELAADEVERARAGVRRARWGSRCGRRPPLWSATVPQRCSRRLAQAGGFVMLLGFAVSGRAPGEALPVLWCYQL